MKWDASNQMHSNMIAAVQKDVAAPAATPSQCISSKKNPHRGKSHARVTPTFQGMAKRRQSVMPQVPVHPKNFCGERPTLKA